MRRHLLTLVIIAAACAAAAGQTPGVNRQGPENEGRRRPAAELPRRPAELENLVNAARVAPPEFAADVLLQLVEAKRVSDREWRRELLEEAFRLAGRGATPFPRDYAGDTMDTREGYASLASDLKLDALSLQSRAVRGMLAVDKRRARELLSEIPPKLPLAALKCEDALVDNVSDFYALLGEVVKESFTPAEVREGGHVLFIQPYVEGMRSPAQVGPVAKLIASVDASAAQLATLVYNFNNALKGVWSDDRTFSFPATTDITAGSLDELVKRCLKHEVPRHELLKAFRLYLTGNLGGTRCADTLRRREPLPGYVRYLNKTLFVNEPVNEEEARPGSLGGRIKTSPYWQTPAARLFLLRTQKLRFGSGSKQLTEEERRSQEWQLELLELLHDVSAWDGAQEKSSVDLFNQKSALYKSMLDLMPPGDKRDEVLLSFIAFLRDNYRPAEGRVDWFLHARSVIRMAQSGPPEERRKVLTALSNSGNNVLQLYGELAAQSQQARRGDSPAVSP